MPPAADLVLCCEPENDLLCVLRRCGITVAHCEGPAEALTMAASGAGLAVLASSYPDQATRLDASFFTQAADKRLRVYVEFPDALPGITTGPVLSTSTERGVVASDFFGAELAAMRILAIHGCHAIELTPPADGTVHMVLASVAGRDMAAYGISDVETRPLLLACEDRRLLICASKFSQFVTARYAATEDWRVIWGRILHWLAPDRALPRLEWTPTVRPRYARDEALPANAEREALVRGVDWHTASRMLVHASWKDGLGTDPLDPNRPCGNGEHGLMEGLRSQVDHLGRQPVATARRSDCNGESALAFALRAGIDDDARSARIAENLLDWLYVHSGMFIEAPEKASHGLIAWTPDPAVALYQDNDVKAMFGCMGTAALVGTSQWDKALLTNILANFRTTGRLGFRGERLEHPELIKRGWRSFWDAPLVRLSPHFEAWTWAAYLWLYDKTQYAPLLERTKRGIGHMMSAYPSAWFWTNGIQQERGRMLLVLSWLLRVEDNAQHRAWLDLIVQDMRACQDECGAIREELGNVAKGYFPPPDSNASYGTNEAPLIHANGEPVADMLYTCNFAFLGLHEAAAVTGNPDYKAMEDKLAEFLVRIQVHSETHPELDSAWFRAFDYERWEYYGSNADAGWGAWCTECGWTQGWIPAVLGLRRLGISFWDLTKDSAIADHMDAIRPGMLPDEAVSAAPQTRRVQHDAVGCTILSVTEPDPRFNPGDTRGLLDGELLEADWGWTWLGYKQIDFEALIDLGAVIPIHALGIVCMQQVFHGMYLPREVHFEVSEDNTNFISAGSATPDISPREEGPLSRALLATAPANTQGRYVRIRALSQSTIPEGLHCAGAKAWLMIDEMLVNPTSDVKTPS